MPGGTSHVTEYFECVLVGYNVNGHVRFGTTASEESGRLDLPLESRILVASSIEVVCTPSLDLSDDPGTNE